MRSIAIQGTALDYFCSTPQRIFDLLHCLICPDTLSVQKIGFRAFARFPAFAGVCLFYRVSYASTV